MSYRKVYRVEVYSLQSRPHDLGHISPGSMFLVQPPVKLQM